MSDPWLKFYPSDWRADPALRMCSIGARGLWMEMLCVMHEAEPRGSLLVNGNSVSERQLAGLAGCSVKDVAALLGELEAAGVFSRDDGVIFSRRMRRDEEKAKRDKANGRKGGNPLIRTVNDGVNPPLNGEDKAQIPEARSQKPEGSSSSSLRSDDAFIQPADAGERGLFGDAEPKPASVEPKASQAMRRNGFMPDSFERWWAKYPHKVGKQDALKAFKSVAKSGHTTFEMLMAGVDRYERTKPPDRPWCNPGTWLRQGRWDDEPDHDTGSTGPHRPLRPSPRGGDAILAGMGNVAARMFAGRPRDADDPGVEDPDG